MAVAVLTTGVRYDPGPRGLGGWASTPTDRGRTLGEATGPELRMRFAAGGGEDSNFSQSAAARRTNMHAWAAAADGEGERAPVSVCAEL